MKHEYGLDIVNELPKDKFDAIILAVAHSDFKGLDIKQLSKDTSVVYDVKGFLDRDIIDARL